MHATLGARVYRVLSQLNDRIKADANAREVKKNFEIVDASSKPDTMRVVPSPATASD